MPKHNFYWNPISRRWENEPEETAAAQQFKAARTEFNLKRLEIKREADLYEEELRTGRKKDLLRVKDAKARELLNLPPGEYDLSPRYLEPAPESERNREAREKRERIKAAIIKVSGLDSDETEHLSDEASGQLPSQQQLPTARPFAKAKLVVG